MIATPKRLAHSGLLAVLVWVGAAGCKPKPPTVVLNTPEGTALPQAPAPSQADEDAARLLAQESPDEVLKKYPGTQAAAEIWESRAKAAQQAGQSGEALLAYEHLLFYRPTFERADAAREQYSGLLMGVGRFDEAEKMLAALYHTAPDTAATLRLGPLWATAAAQAGHGGKSVQIWVELANLTGLPSEVRRQMQDKAVQAVSVDLNFNDAASLWPKSQNQATWAFLQPVLGYKLAKIYYHTRDYPRCEEMLKYVAEHFPADPFAAMAQTFLEHLRARFEIDPRAIGVVLPLSGKFKQYGERSLQAINLAIGAHGPLKVFVKDSQGEPNIAAQAVETLVLEHHVMAVLGPMFSNEAMAAALKAEELSVPLLALSHREGLPEIGPFVLRTALTVEAQARALAKVAFETLGFTKFAILYPRSRYGIDFVNAFWNEVDARHGEIRGAELYEPDQTTFREPVRRLVGRWYLGARPDFKEAVDALRRQKLTPLRMKSEMEKLDKTLPPIVDFEAIVIPDSGRQIGLIAPALAFEDVVLTHDPKTLEKIKKATKAEVFPVTLLGASTWNSAQTLDSCESYCEDSVFVDAYFPNSTDTKVRDFIGVFREATSGAEPYLPEAQAFDTAGLLKNVMASAKPSSRKALRDALYHGGPYHGVTGKMSFNEQGEAQKELFVLTIKEHTIRLYEAPPEPPRG